MSISRAIRTLNGVEIGAIDSAALEALLADPGHYADWQMLGTFQGQVDRMWSSDLTIDTILGSGRALRALASVRGKHFYGSEYLKFMSPNAWGVYLPDASAMTLAAAGGIYSWASAVGNTSQSNEMIMAAVAAQPIPDIVNSPIYGQPVANFVSNDYLAATGLGGNSGVSYSIFVVYRLTNASASGFVGSGTTIGFGSSAGGAATSFNTALGTFNNNVGELNAWAMSRFRRQGGLGLVHSLNGGAESTPITATASSAELTGAMSIGRGANSFMSGQIAEVWIVVGNGEANSPEIQRITKMLKSKYEL